MLALSLLWLALGVVMGLVANGARLRPALWARWGWRELPALGAGLALAGGWLGTALLGRLYGTPMALWFGVLGLAAGPWLTGWLWARLRTRRASDAGVA